MFDYQAGERYRLTLIVVGLAGMMAGIFFCVLLMPTPEPTRHKGPAPAYMRDPDVSGRRSASAPAASGAAAAMVPTSAQAKLTDPLLAKTLIEQWLPLAWDLSAGSAQTSQERAILAMTPDCAEAYRKNIWTPDLSKQLNEAGLKSEFQASSISVGEPLADGSVVVYVSGNQILNIPGKGATTRAVKLEYLVKMTAEGMRIAGISEGGKSM